MGEKTELSRLIVMTKIWCNGNSKWCKRGKLKLKGECIMETLKDLIEEVRNNKKDREMMDLMNDVKFHQWQLQHRAERLQFALNELINSKELESISRES